MLDAVTDVASNVDWSTFGLFGGGMGLGGVGVALIQWWGSRHKVATDIQVEKDKMELEYTKALINFNLKLLEVAFGRIPSQDTVE